MKQADSIAPTRLLKYWGICIVESIFLLPLLLPYLVFMDDQYLSSSWFYIVPLVILAGVLLGRRLTVLWEKVGVILFTGAIFSGAAVLMGGEFLQSMVIMTIFTAQGVTVPQRKHRYRLYWFGVTLYLLAGIIYPFIPLLDRMLPILTVAGVFCLAWTLFSTNQTFLSYSTYAKDSSSAFPMGLRLHNRVWIGSIVLMAVLLAAGAGGWLSSGLLGLLRFAGSWLKNMLERLTRWQPEKEIIDNTDDTNVGEMILPEEMLEMGDGHSFLDTALLIVAGIIIAGVVVWGLYWLYKNGKGLWRRMVDSLLGLLRRVSKAEQDDSFEDEEVILRTWKAKNKRSRQRKPAFSFRIGKHSEPSEEIHNNRELIRYYYRCMLRAEQMEGHKKKAFLTPRELEAELLGEAAPKRKKDKAAWEKRRSASNLLLDLYYRARYGDDEPSDDEMARIKREMNM